MFLYRSFDCALLLFLPIAGAHLIVLLLDSKGNSTAFNWFHVFPSPAFLLVHSMYQLLLWGGHCIHKPPLRIPQSSSFELGWATHWWRFCVCRNVCPVDGWSVQVRTTWLRTVIEHISWTLPRVLVIIGCRWSHFLPSKGPLREQIEYYLWPQWSSSTSNHASQSWLPYLANLMPSFKYHCENVRFLLQSDLMTSVPAHERRARLISIIRRRGSKKVKYLSLKLHCRAAILTWPGIRYRCFSSPSQCDAFNCFLDSDNFSIRPIVMAPLSM